ncbi:MAG TPA: VOC family protein [Acidimicrobiales bacterium]|nr:VOC family protein [Acidimicrobiales bacterium]
MGVVDAGRFHRLGLAVRDVDAAEGWLRRTFGAARTKGTGAPHQRAEAGTHAADEPDMRGASTRLLWHGGYPAILLGAADEDSVIGRFLQRWGPGLHSVAWEIGDMWAAEHRLRDRGIRIAAVNVAGRHFFMHPQDTHGLLMEWTDTFFVDDHRPTERLDPARVTVAPAEGGGEVEGAALAWVTAVVRDAASTAAFLGDLAGARPVAGNAQRDARVETTVDVAVGDVTIRLVTPRTPASAYHAVLEAGPRLWSYALRVPHLDAALEALERHGVRVCGREGGLAWTDPASTMGIPMELTG